MAKRAEYKEIDTPAVLIDLDQFESNLDKLATYFSERKAKLRPHVKSHKTPEIARRQIQAGAIGLTCAKLGEAEAMAHAGLNHLLIANQVVGPLKTRRLVELSKKIDVMVAVESAQNVSELNRVALNSNTRIQVIIEVEVGMKRCGVRPGPKCVELARKIVRSKGLVFRGIMGYEGHCVMIRDPEERRRKCTMANNRLALAKRLIEEAGMPVEIVSGGGTGTYDVSGNHPDFTEIQVGSYVLMDRVYQSVRPEFGISLSILATVISRPTGTRAVIDAGLKAFSHGFALPKPKALQGARMISLSEEHGTMELRGPAREIKVGDRVELFTAHCCEVMNLHERAHAVRRGKVVDVWPITARLLGT